MPEVATSPAQKAAHPGAIGEKGNCGVEGRVVGKGVTGRRPGVGRCQGHERGAQSGADEGVMAREQGVAFAPEALRHATGVRSEGAAVG